MIRSLRNLSYKSRNQPNVGWLAEQKQFYSSSPVVKPLAFLTKGHRSLI